jgi:hypothetical protein
MRPVNHVAYLIEFKAGFLMIAEALADVFNKGLGYQEEFGHFGPRR